MTAPSGFTFDSRRNGELLISHQGRSATVLRGRAAERLLAKLDVADHDTAQHLLARATGNYKRGNERR